MFLVAHFFSGQYLRLTPWEKLIIDALLAIRENCQCSQCVHPETKQRAVEAFSVCIIDVFMAGLL